MQSATVRGWQIVRPNFDADDMRNVTGLSIKDLSQYFSLAAQKRRVFL
jgi:hypothetical protein